MISKDAFFLLETREMVGTRQMERDKNKSNDANRLRNESPTITAWSIVDCEAMVVPTPFEWSVVGNLGKSTNNMQVVGLLLHSDSVALPLPYTRAPATPRY